MFKWDGKSAFIICPECNNKSQININCIQCLNHTLTIYADKIERLWFRHPFGKSQYFIEFNNNSYFLRTGNTQSGEIICLFDKYPGLSRCKKIIDNLGAFV